MNHELNRDRIAKKVFKNHLLLQSLEKILHPAVHDEIEKQYRQTMDDQKSVIFMAEIPLLFETRSEKNYNKTIAIISDTELCLNRFRKSTAMIKINLTRAWKDN